jgi:hypothetical protein
VSHRNHAFQPKPNFGLCYSFGRNRKRLVLNNKSNLQRARRDEKQFRLEPKVRPIFAETETLIFSRNWPKPNLRSETSHRQSPADPVYSIEKGSSKENVTVVCAFSASGQTWPPMIINRYERSPDKIVRTVPLQWGTPIAKSWLEVFYECVANIFHLYLVKQNVIFLVILFVNGHKSHIIYDLSVLCNNFQIVHALYPNAIRILQPAHVTSF